MHRRKFLSVAVLIIAAVAVVASSLILARKSSSGVYQKEPAAAQQPASLKDTDTEVKATLPLFYRLNQDYIRGSAPAKGGISTLLRLGVKSLVDLRSSYDHTEEIGVAAERVGLRYYWLPMSVWNPPTDAEASQFLSIVTDNSKGPFYVFCADGLHRAGEMSAVYRIAHDNWSVEQALKEMDEIGFNPYYYNLRSYVWTYARKFKPSAVPPTGRRLSSFERAELGQDGNKR